MKNENEAGNLLPIHESDGEPTVNSIVIAKELGNQHKNLLELIQTHQKTIEKDFGLIAFETLKSESQRGKPTRVAELNEGQALFVATLAKNSVKAVEVKSKIVKSFLFFRQMSYELSSKSSSLVHIGENITMSVIPNDKHVFLVTNKNFALSLAMAPSTLSSNKNRHRNVFKDGEQYISDYTAMDYERNVEYKTTVWTQRGVIEMARIVKSGNSVVFRDWADRLQNKEPQNLALRNTQPQKRKHNRLTQERIISIMADIAKIEDNELRCSIADKITGDYHE